MSYHIVPPSVAAAAGEHVVSTSATAHPASGTHDTFRYGLKSAAQDVDGDNQSPLQARLQKWDETQTALQQTMQRNTFGMAMPLRIAMEKKIVNQSLHHPLIDQLSTLGGSHNIHQEILCGTDESIDAVDFMGSGRDLGEVLDVSAVMEQSRGI